MLSIEVLVFIVVLLALSFDFINGFHDTANAIATSVSTKAIAPQHAVILAGVMNFLGAMSGTAVAKTIGSDLADPSLVSQPVIIAALLGAIFWNLLTWYYGIPSSSSHALIGGIVGAVVAGPGVNGLKMAGIQKVVIILITSPIIGLIVGFIIMNALWWISRRQTPGRVNQRFLRLQVLAATAAAYSHGMNDAQKAMGIITMALFSAGMITVFEVPFWVKVACALAMGIGTAMGGWKIIKTVAGKIVKLEPVNGFAADLSSSLVIYGASHFGMPVSTTHVVTSCIMGVGSAKRVSAVRWTVARQIITAWFLTIPASAAVAALSFYLISFLVVQ